MKPIRILLVEDHELVRRGIKLLIEENENMKVTGEAGDGDAAVELAHSLAPDIVIMDISMPKANGLSAAETIHKTCPEIKILMLTRHADTRFLRQLIEAGVSGYVLKQSAATELLNAIQALAEGNSYFDTTIVQSVMKGYARKSVNLRGELNPDLTEREEGVLRLTARGYSNKKIAELFKVSVKTVETHKANGMGKIGANDRVDVVNYAIFRGWLEDK
jgi:DNA-binding NarL/FixJ family response regulator